jgi:putative transposase
MLASGRPLRDVVASLGISRSTYQRWRRRSEGLTGGADRLLELEQENTRLRRIVADRDLEIEMLRELSRGTY